MIIIDILAYITLIFLTILSHLSLYSAPINAILTICYFFKNIIEPSKYFKRNAILLLILNFSSILWTKVGIFLYELGYALSNEASKYYEFHNGLAKTLEHLSYVLPFLILFVFIFIKKPKENNELETMTNKTSN